MVLKIAVTGNIASGKSQVEKFLAECGYPVYDSDEIAHEVLGTIKEFYGCDVFSGGKIDRKKLGALVFSDPELRKQLENITHPKIKSKITELFEKHKHDKFIFVSVPLLYESGFDKLFDKVLFISVDKDLQLQRLILRNNYSEEEALKRINSQMCQEEKLEKADYVITNNSTLNELSNKVKEFLASIC